MKVLFLSRYQNKVYRGAENFVSELAQRLNKYHDVEVLSQADADDLSLILSKKPDLVIPVNGRLQVIKVSLGRLIGGKYKVLITGHSGIGMDDIINITLGKPDVFVALSQKAEDWAKRFSWGTTKVVKIPNGVDLNKFSSKGRKINVNLKHPIILSVGALEWYKGHEKTIKAVANLKDVSLLVVGKGSQKDYLKNLGEKVLGDRFKIMSFPNSQMPLIYRSVDIFTLASWDREAFGIVYLEAMASNLPLVAPNDETRREIIGDAGVLTEVDNSEKYAQAIKHCLETNWDSKPRQQAEKFSWDKIVKLYEEAILSL